MLLRFELNLWWYACDQLRRFYEYYSFRHNVKEAKTNKK